MAERLKEVLSPEASERVYLRLAEAVDAAGPERSLDLLARLVLLLANHAGEDATRAAIAEAKPDSNEAPS